MWGLIAYSMCFGKSISTGVIGDDTFGTINKLASGDYSFVYYSFMCVMYEKKQRTQKGTR